MSTVIGIDVGGTKVAAQRLTPDGLGDHQQLPTALGSTDTLIDQFAQIVELAAGGEPYDAVGMGVPSVVRFATGEVVSSVNIPLAGVKLREVLGERLGVPVFIDNDGTVAALAEAHDEQLALVSPDMVMITIGTGIGGGVVTGGKIFRGASGGAAELGHILIALPSDPDFPTAIERFPQHGSLESLASGQALDKAAQAAAAENPESALGRLAAAGRLVHGADATQAAQAGDAVALAVFKRWAHALGIGIASVINTFDPLEVVIGGGGAAAGKILLDHATEIASGYVLTGLQGNSSIRLARFGPAAGVIGAALLARQELEQR